MLSPTVTDFSMGKLEVMTSGEQGQAPGTRDHRNRVVTQAAELAGLGAWVVPISGEQKHPMLKSWQRLRLKPDELPSYLSNGTSGFGVLLGVPPRNLVDVDLDAAKAVFAARLYPGPPTNRIKGRPGNPSSHYLYQVMDQLPPTRSFKDSRTGAMLIEILSSGRQAIMPPSRVRQDDGHVEELCWDKCGQFGMVHAAEIVRWTAQLATIALLATYWPASDRHEARMALGGSLARAGWPEEKVIGFVRAVVQLAQPGDRDAYAKVSGDTGAAFAKVQLNKPVTGLPRLAELLGDDVVSAVSKWLDLCQDSSDTASAVSDTSIGSPNTDLANGRRLASRHGSEIRYCKKLGWLFYDGTRWAHDEKGDGEIMLRAKETALSIYEEARNEKNEHRRKLLAAWAIQSESAARLQNMIELAKSEPGIAVTIDHLDADPLLFNCQSGTLDLRTGQLLKHRPEDLLTKISPIILDPLATCPHLTAFLERIFVEKPRLIEYIQRVAGYCLTGLNHEQVLFFLYGLGANGKTTLIEMFRMVLGEYSRNINPNTLLNMNDSEAKFDLADIYGARIVVATEPEGGRRLAESLVKQVTGSDHIKARNMYKAYFEYVPQFKIFIVSNHKFTVDGGSEAIARRLHMLPFEERIPEGERDKLFLNKLRGELSGILNWAIAGCLAWQRDGLGMPDEVKAATREFLVENDEVQQWIDTSCVVGEEVSEAAGDLYRNFEGFSNANGNEHPMKAPAFGRKLHDKGFKRKTQKRGSYIRLGIALRRECQ